MRRANTSPRCTTTTCGSRIFSRRWCRALERDESLSVAFCDHHVVDEGGALDAAATEANTRRWHRDRLQPGTLRPFTEAAVVWQAVPAAMAALFRKSAIDWADFPAEVGTYYDIWLAYQAARSGAGAHYEPRRLTRYRVHGQSETRSWGSAAGRLKAMRQAEFVFRRYLEDPGLAEIRPVVAGLYARKALSLAAALIQDGAAGEARRVLSGRTARAARGAQGRDAVRAAARRSVARADVDRAAHPRLGAAELIDRNIRDARLGSLAYNYPNRSTLAQK